MEEGGGGRKAARLAFGSSAKVVPLGVGFPLATMKSC